MAEFPSPLERTVASALLLLSISPSPPSTPISEDEWLFEKNIEGKCSREISAFCDYSNTSSSILTTSDASSHTPPLERLLFLTYPCRHQLMLNVVRKSRSKLVRISENRNLSSTDEVTLSSGSASSETTSCLSSSSSVVTSAPIHRLVTRAEKKLEMIRHAWRKKQIASAHMRRRAEAILSYLSDGCSSEVKIRQVIGDSPDTSKALRM